MLSSRSRSVIRHARGRIGESVADAARARIAKGKLGAAAAGRKAVARGVPDGRAAWLDYGAVLDGHTLNLCLRPPREIDLAEPGLHAELVFESGHERRTAPLEAVAGPSRRAIEGAVLIGASIGGLELPAGRWRLSVRLVSPARRPVELAVRGLKAGSTGAGPTLAQQVCPLTGARHRFGLSATGRARLDVRAATPAAELVRGGIDLASGTLVIELVGAPSALDHIEAVCDDEPHPVPCPPWQGNAGPAGLKVNQASVFVPLDEMTRTDSAAERQWTFVAVLADGSRLRVARQLHGLRHPLRVFALQSLQLCPRPGVLVCARTGFTRRGTFELFLRPRSSSIATRQPVRTEGQIPA